MANTIKIKNSGTASNVPSSLEFGELGLNYADGKLYYKNSSNVIVEFLSSGSVDSLSDVVITSPAEFQTLTYNGTNWVNAYASDVVLVRNDETTTLTTGTVVYVSGSTGDHAKVKRADNDSDTTSATIIGVVGANISASENGPVITLGYVDGIDLSTGYTAGDILWLGENGAFTTTKPTAPEHLVFVGTVIRATNNGIIFVAPQNGYELDELHNVSAGSPSSGDFLKYNGSVWVNDPINLGTDTVGDYVSSLVAGTGISLANNSGEGATPTITNSGVTSIAGTANQITASGSTGSVTLSLPTNIVISGSVTANTNLVSNYSSGDEGGEINLATAATNTTLSGPVKIDIFQNKIRFFEGGGSTRGAYIDLTATGSTVGTNLLGTSGAMNYEQQQSGKVSNVTANDATIVSRSFTTSGYPVQVLVTGDAENTTAGAWIKLQLYRDSTAIGKIIHVESSAGSENVPYALTVIDTPSAGTYTYALKTVSAAAAGSFNFGETDGPVLTMIELAGRTGATGATGATGSTGATGPEGGTSTLTTKGDILTRSASSVARLPVGSDTTILRANSSATTGLDWVAGSVTVNGTAISLGGSGTITANAATLTGTSLNSSVVGSSLTSVGTLTSLTVSGNVAVTGSVVDHTLTNQQTSSYTLVIGDDGKMVEMNVGTANNLTVPADNTVNFPVGTSIDILQVGAGQTTIVATSGVTINRSTGLKLRTQWSAATLIKRAANTWVAIGDLSA